MTGLGVTATVTGIVTAFGHTHWTFVSLRGEAVTIQGGGLYAHESMSMAAQGVGMDLVTLLVAIPLLLISVHLAATGSKRGQLLQLGAFAYFTYAYLVITFGVAYNQLFLLYVVMLSASLAGLVLSAMAIHISGMATWFSPRFARRTVAWAVIGVGGMFTLLWLGRIVPAMLSGKTPVGVESYTTLSVQAADLSLVIPTSLLAGVLLLRRHPLGYLLSAPVLLFVAIMGLGLVGMVIAMAALGTTVGVADFVPAVTTALIGLLLVGHLVRSVRHEVPASTTPRPLGALHAVDAMGGSNSGVATGCFNAAADELRPKVPVSW